MSHTNYHEIKADSYFDLGLKEGQLFSSQLNESIENKKQLKNWESKLRKSKDYFALTEEAFPHLIEELQGYAKGAGVKFEDLWALSLEDELFDIDKCTTAITNDGKLIAHNEDWDANSKNAICVVKKSIPNLTILELFYYNTLGGNSISINSNGFVQTINTLTHTDKQNPGIPRNITARWLSETSNPINDFKRFASLQRSAGYSHNFINPQGEIWSVESSAEKKNISQVASPYVHTNHYLTDLKTLENNDNSSGTFDRYKYAIRKITKSMSLNQMKELMSDGSQGRKISLFNERTIARMIIDIENLKAYIWLLREDDKGWIDYDIDFGTFGS